MIFDHNSVRMDRLELARSQNFGPQRFPLIPIPGNTNMWNLVIGPEKVIKFNLKLSDKNSHGSWLVEGVYILPEVGIDFPSLSPPFPINSSRKPQFTAVGRSTGECTVKQTDAGHKHGIVFVTGKTCRNLTIHVKFYHFLVTEIIYI